MKKERILFIINPKSGMAQIKPRLLEILNLFSKEGFDVRVVITQAGGQIGELLQEYAGTFDLLAVSGGDGTLNETVGGMLQGGFSYPVCYIPAGSTNDFAVSLKLPKKMEEAAALAVSGQKFACDAGKFNDHYFVYVAAFGLFTEVSYGTDQNLKNMLGHAAYVLRGVQSLSAVKAYSMKIRYIEPDTGKRRTVSGKFLYGMVTNSHSVGGFKNITGKDVKLNDGLLEVSLLRMPRSGAELNQMVSSLVEMGPRTAAKRVRKSEFYHGFKTAHLEVVSEEEIAWTLDGEFGGKHKKVVISDIPEAFAILTPTEEKREK